MTTKPSATIARRGSCLLPAAFGAGSMCSAIGLKGTDRRYPRDKDLVAECERDGEDPARPHAVPEVACGLGGRLEDDAFSVAPEQLVEGRVVRTAGSRDDADRCDGRVGVDLGVVGEVVDRDVVGL